jgi:hypothetical protein
VGRRASRGRRSSGSRCSSTARPWVPGRRERCARLAGTAPTAPSRSSTLRTSEISQRRCGAIARDLPVDRQRRRAHSATATAHPTPFPPQRLFTPNAFSHPTPFHTQRLFTPNAFSHPTPSSPRHRGHARVAARVLIDQLPAAGAPAVLRCRCRSWSTSDTRTW